MDKQSNASGSEHSYVDVGYRSSNGPGTNGGVHVHSHNHQHNHEASTSAMLNHSYSKLSDNFGSPAQQPYFPDPSVTTTRKSVKFESEIPLLLDEEDKYRRRSPFESLSRWLKYVHFFKC
jgi:hypothetical protein